MHGGGAKNIKKYFYGDIDITFFDSAQKPGFWHSVQISLTSSQNHLRINMMSMLESWEIFVILKVVEYLMPTCEVMI